MHPELINRHAQHRLGELHRETARQRHQRSLRTRTARALKRLARRLEPGTDQDAQPLAPFKETYYERLA